MGGKWEPEAFGRMTTLLNLLSAEVDIFQFNFQIAINLVFLIQSCVSTDIINEVMVTNVIL